MTDSTIETDFVIIGAGSAGAVAAARLSEDPRTDVVLLEAGGADKNVWIHIPLGYGKTIIDPSVNWCYETEPDLGGRRFFWPRGKVLGGSSSINGLIYIRGQAEDFDHWRQLGNQGWSYEDVLPYFRRAEDQERGGDELHGAGGPLAVSDLKDHHPICEAFIASALAIGIPRNDDFNGASQEGVGYYQLTTRNGRRCSTAVGYLRPAGKRANLRVMTNSLAERIRFEGNRAVGAEVTRGGETLFVRARREVILSSGAINSPQLLMLSGIGPAAHLAEHGIEIVADLPGVGQDLQDHYQSRIVHRCRLPITVNDIMRSWPKKIAAGLDYLLFRRGPLTIAAGQVGLFARTRPELATPDVQYHFIIFSNDRPAEGLHKFPGFSTTVCQLRPESRGEIRLRSRDPHASPAIHPNYLATELDRRTLIAGIRLGRRIAEGSTMRALIEAEYLPGAGVETDAELLDFARRYGGTVFHPTSTCRMGPDPMAVVDARLRVRGVERLRVADASIMPTVVSGNTNAAAIMIGERVADFARSS
ncbi:MAG TPA: choline dehydrogenase [Acetobacteraceae bacterium]|nr:choline dehydrogenase [Acetobacteraceae bacterium]